jgi:flagellar biosynthesis anti-sigma factor FlgM
MSSINSVGGNSPVQKIITNPIKKEISTQAPQSSNPTDKVELSGMSHLLKALKTNDVRTDKVADIRAQIEAGTYETDDKLDAAADKLLDDLLK